MGYVGLAQVTNGRGRLDAALAALEQAAIHAQRLGLPHYEIRLESWRGGVRAYGSTPAPDLLAWLEERQAHGSRSPHHRLLQPYALAMLGRFDDARAILSDLCSELADRGATIPLALATGHIGTEVERLADNPSAAVSFGRESSRLFEQVGERGFHSSTAAQLAQALYTLDQLDDAAIWARRAAELAGTADVSAQMQSRQVKAKVLARGSQLAEAEELAREAISIGRQTDMINDLAEANADLDEVLVLAGRPAAAAIELEKALELYERKGNVVAAQRTHDKLTEAHTSSRSTDSK